MAFDVSYIYKLRDQITPELRKIQRNMQQLDKSAGNTARRLGKSFTDLGKSLSVKVTAPIGLVGGLALKAAANMEKMETGFVGILGSGEKASALVKDLFEFTATTPFQLEGVARSAKQLLAAGVASEDVTNQLQMLGDISAAATIPLSDMSQIFAKIKNKGKAMTEEILQMSDRGIPVIDILSKEFGVAKNAIFDMASKGQISFKMMERAMQNMTKEGGFANKAMILQSKTLSGVFSTLKDNVNLMMAQIGEVFLEDAKKFAVAVIEMAKKVKNFAQENQGLTKAILIAAGAFAVLAPALIVIGQMTIGIYGLVAAFKLLNLVMLKNPIGLVVTGVLALVAGIVTFKDEIMAAYDAVAKFFSKLNVFSKFKNMFDFGGDDIERTVNAQLNTSSQGLQTSGGLKNISENTMNGEIKVTFANAPEGMKSYTSMMRNDTNMKLGTNSIMTAAQ